jgi:hypothetical protein
MKPEAQRIAIAEACGWTWVLWGKNSIRITAPSGYKSNEWRTSEPDNSQTLPRYGDLIESVEHWCGGLPDYLDDLNACHEMEKYLRPGQYPEYVSLLCKNTFDRNDAVLTSVALFHATAAQRAEAFLRAIGKWVD